MMAIDSSIIVVIGLGSTHAPSGQELPSHHRDLEKYHCQSYRQVPIFRREKKNIVPELPFLEGCLAESQLVSFYQG